MPSGALTPVLIDALNTVAASVADSAGFEAAQRGVSEIRKLTGDSVFPTLYELHSGRLWLVAQAGYTGVFDGIALDRGVMARSVASGATAFVADASAVPDYLHAQPGFVSEVTVPVGEFVFNLETTEPLTDEVVAPVEAFTMFLVERIRAGEEESLTRQPIARALGPMVALMEREAILEYAARIAATRLGLDLAQVILVTGEKPLAVVWRSPGTWIEPRSPDEVFKAIYAKRAFVSWIGAADQLLLGWDADLGGVLFPLLRRGEMIGGLVGAGRNVHDDANARDAIAAIAAHTAACLERATLELSLSDALMARSRFIAAVSHELRTPLTAIVGFTDLLRINEDMPIHERREFLDLVRDNSTHLLALVTDILDVARAEAGQLRLEATDIVDLTAIVSDSTNYVSPQAESARTAVIVTPAPRIDVLGEELRIRQIVVNLLSNAVKFTPGGKVRASIHRSGHRVILRVEDDGEGIAPDLLGTLFRPFSGRSVFDPQAGTGLGLVISRRLAEAMGGSLELESAGPGFGSTATLTLPAADMTASSG
ncbi:MAG TPA: HAMP domain-containing sensor histidine kinase [Acidimicrobiia bacterium]|nr:HAMP domain-containing sensor histidine kinase [Acidimicrobiia bacterium]